MSRGVTIGVIKEQSGGSQSLDQVLAIGDRPVKIICQDSDPFNIDDYYYNVIDEDFTKALYIPESNYSGSDVSITLNKDYPLNSELKIYRASKNGVSNRNFTIKVEGSNQLTNTFDSYSYDFSKSEASQIILKQIELNVWMVNELMFNNNNSIQPKKLCGLLTYDPAQSNLVLNTEGYMNSNKSFPNFGFQNFFNGYFECDFPNVNCDRVEILYAPGTGMNESDKSVCLEIMSKGGNVFVLQTRNSPDSGGDEFALSGLNLYVEFLFY